MNTIEEPQSNNTATTNAPETLAAARVACQRLAPLWPLQHFVAVNPFLGLTSRPFAEGCELLQRMAPGGMQMPLNYYRGKFTSGVITDADLESALTHARQILGVSHAEELADWNVGRLKAVLHEDSRGAGEEQMLSIAEAVDRARGTSWSVAIVESIARFCAAYFDEGQSAWRLPWKAQPLFAAWREAASLDASFELLGLPDFRKWVSKLPSDAESAITTSLAQLGIAANAAEDFLHKQLFTIRGWAGYVQYRVRANRMHGRGDDSLLHLLAIRLAFDAALLAHFDGPALREFWPVNPDASTSDTLAKLLLQFTDEYAWQRQLTQKLRVASPTQPHALPARPSVQAVFCIDVRSEILRRALEAASPKFETLGFAGFFGLPIEYIPFGQHHGASQCPVLLTPKFRVRETLRAASEADEKLAWKRKRLGKRLSYSWNSFKTSAISCFSFVETAGLAFGVKLVRDAFAPKTPHHGHSQTHRPELDLGDDHGVTGIAPEDRVQLALGALRNMGLTNNFARLVVLCGHGSATTNNPHGSGLDCGACGGHAGDVNARVGVAILNNPTVRTALATHGIAIPDDTWFLAGLHNTTTDEVTLYDLDLVPASHRGGLAELQSALLTAGKRARRERAALLGLDCTDPALDDLVTARSRDWAQVRPEWGLAGNAAFIAAPRSRTSAANLEGRVFLHNYDHRADTDNSTLDLIMTAPMVVANWINLQYFASTVNNAVFGSGNKVIHNVVGTIGVCQGNGGDLQTGLPLQSVHDGTKWIHEPLRLHVFLEAPRERIAAILAKHEGVRHLVENGWLLLFAIEEEGAALYRHTAGQWEQISS